MPKKSLKSKRGTSKKGGKGYKRTRKMKGGVSYNPVFSTTLLPKGTYYELNNYNDDPSRPPEVIDSRLLPTLKGGKKKNTRKRRGGNYRKLHELYYGRKSKGEQKEIDEKEKAKAEEEKQARKEDMEANYTEFRGDMLYDNFDKIDDKDPLKNVNFYYFDMGHNKRELGKLIKKGGQQYVSEYGGYSRNNSLLEFEKSTMVATTQWTDQNIQQPNSFYVLTTDFEKKGGKKKKRRTQRKMKGGSLVGTDLITGLNTTNTNSVIAFGTTGGTEYMYNTLAGKSIDSGPYMSPETPVEPVLA